MLKPGKTYRVFRSKVTTNGDHSMLSISESAKNPKTGEWESQGWWSICIEGVYTCERNDNYRYTIEKITGISQREYNGKNYVTIFAEGKMDTGRSDPNGFEPIKDDESLPF